MYRCVKGKVFITDWDWFKWSGGIYIYAFNYYWWTSICITSPTANTFPYTSFFFLLQHIYHLCKSHDLCYILKKSLPKGRTVYFMFIGFMNALVTNWQSSNSTCHDLCLEVMMSRHLCNISLLTAMWASDVSLTEVTVEGTVCKLCFCYHLVVKVSHWSLLDVRETTEKYLSACRGQCRDALFTGTTRGQ